MDTIGEAGVALSGIRVGEGAHLPIRPLVCRGDPFGRDLVYWPWRNGGAVVLARAGHVLLRLLQKGLNLLLPRDNTCARK